MESPEKTIVSGENDLAEDEEQSPANSAGGRVSAVVLVLLFAGGAYEAYSMGIGSPANPGPGLWPMFVSSIGAILSIVLAIHGTSWLPSESGTYRWSIIMALAICGYMIALPWFGFLVATTLLCLLVTRVLGGARWITAIATAVLAPILSYLVFNQVLGVPAIGPSLF